MSKFKDIIFNTFPKVAILRDVTFTIFSKTRGVTFTILEEIKELISHTVTFTILAESLNSVVFSVFDTTRSSVVFYINSVIPQLRSVVFTVVETVEPINHVIFYIQDDSGIDPDCIPLDC